MPTHTRHSAPSVRSDPANWLVFGASRVSPRSWSPIWDIAPLDMRTGHPLTSADRLLPSTESSLPLPVRPVEDLSFVGGPVGKFPKAADNLTGRFKEEFAQLGAAVIIPAAQRVR